MAAARALHGSGRGKSGLHGTRMPGNARRGRPQGKCHRKQTAGVPPVRVKRCGKSAPPTRQRAGHGKPHPEQDHVGTRAAHWRYVRARQARFRADVRVGCLTGPATAPLDEWPSPGNRYRTRLTGHLAVLISGNPVWAHQAMPNHPRPIRGVILATKPPKSEQKQNNIGNLPVFQPVTRHPSNSYLTS